MYMMKQPEVSFMSHCYPQHCDPHVYAGADNVHNDLPS